MLVHHRLLGGIGRSTLRCCFELLLFLLLVEEEEQEADKDDYNSDAADYSSDDGTSIVLCRGSWSILQKRSTMDFWLIVSLL